MSSTTQASEKVWLITGCSSGMGLAFARAALAAGHAVIASSRNPSKSKDLVEEFTSQGSHWITLDVSAPEGEVNAQLDAAVAIHGRIDVLLNNAGQAFQGTVEDTPLSEVRRGFDVNFFGTWTVIKRIAPVMREQKSGTIIANSSILGFASLPAGAVYGTTKHALTGLMDVLSWEMMPFGVRVIVLEPGGVRTGFLSGSQGITPLSDGYKGTIVQAIPDSIIAEAGKEAGDPAKMAQRVVEAVDGTGITGEAIARLSVPPGYAIRLPMGSDASALYDQYKALLSETTKQMADVSKTTDFEGVSSKYGEQA